MDLRRLGIAVEFGKKASVVFAGPFSEVIDEGFDHIPAGASQLFGSAELSGIALHEMGIELVLADQEAQAIAQPRLGTVRTIAIRAA